MRKSLLQLMLAALLGINAAIITYWKSTWSAHLLDYAYLAEISHRIFLGQVPYRDFLLVLTPGVYFITSTIMKLTGGFSHQWLVIQAMCVTFLTSLVSFFVFLRLSKRLWLTVLLSLCILPAGHGTHPYPDYGIWTTLIVMSTILCLTYFPTTTLHAWLGFVIGILSAVSFLFKQNVGFVFAAVVAVVHFFTFIFSRSKSKKAGALFVWLGQGLVTGGFLGWLIWQRAFSHFVYGTYTFPKLVRNPGANLLAVVADYNTTLPILAPVFFAGFFFFCIFMALRLVKDHNIRKWISISVSAVALLAWGYGLVYAFRLIPDSIDLLITLVWVFVMIVGAVAFLGNSIESVRANKRPALWFLPLVLLLTMHAGFITANISWSVFPTWPLLYALLAWSYPVLKRMFAGFPMFLLVGSGLVIPLYAMSGYMYTDAFSHFSGLYTVGPNYRSTKGNIAGLSNPGFWVPTFEDLLADTEKRIPKTDTVAFIPGDDVFLSASGRNNVMRCSQWNIGTCDTFGEKLEREILEKKIDWIIMKDVVMFPGAYGYGGSGYYKQVPLNVGYILQADIDGIYKIYKRPPQK